MGSSVATGTFNCDWLIIPFGAGGAPINEKDVALQKQADAVAHRVAILEKFGINGVDYGQGAGYNEYCTADFSGQEELDVYWYHPDHLGSSSFITGLDGEVNQNIEYFPSGQTFVENHLNSYNTPYRFNAKELDDETGYYYYGARYYNPRVSLWLNVDPLASYDPMMNGEHYIDGEHNGGVYNSGNLNPYSYTYNNPIRYIDPDGKQTESSATKMHDDNDMSQVVTIRGGRYYQNTTNTWASFKNWVNSEVFGGDSDYWVEKKPYNFEDNLMTHRIVNESAGALVGGVAGKLVGKVASPLLGKLLSKAQINQYAKIGSTGKVGEDALKLLGGESQV